MQSCEKHAGSQFETSFSNKLFNRRTSLSEHDIWRLFLGESLRENIFGSLKAGKDKKRKNTCGELPTSLSYNIVREFALYLIERLLSAFVAFCAMSDDDGMALVNSMETMTITVGVVSCMAGLSIVVTLLFFPSMMYTERSGSSIITNQPQLHLDEHTTSIATTSTTRGELNVYSHMILMLSLSEAIAAGAFAMGYPASDSACLAQGLILQFFQRAKWIWSSLIGVQLYRFMVHETKGFKVWQMHAICWSFCLLLEFVPMLDSIEYGSDDESRGSMVCYFKTNARAVHMYHWFVGVYFVPLVVCVSIMIYFAYHLWKRFKYFTTLAVQTEGTTQISRLVRTMILYPLTMLISSFPNMFMFLFSSIDPEYADEKTRYMNGNICFAWSFTYGVWLFAIFFINSQEAKRRWRAYLFNVPYLDIGNRLVRSDGAWQQTTEEVNRIETGMDNALDTATFSSAAGRSFERKKNQGSTNINASSSVLKTDNSGMENGNSSRDGIAIKGRNGESQDEIPTSTKHGISSTLAASISGNGSPVYSSQSAQYGGGRGTNISDEELGPDDHKSPLHIRTKT